MATNDYFTKIVSITEKYLGPASERFVRRQLEFHLNKKPEEITKSDVKKLSTSVGVALSLLVNDKSMIADAVKDLEKIG